MPNPQQRLEMAQLAYRGKNYDEAYKKYSQVLENEFDNEKAWIGKGLSAGQRSGVDNPSFDECTVCLEKASELGLSSDDEKFIAEQIVEISLSYIKKVNQRVAGIIAKNKRKKGADDAIEYAAGEVRDMANRYEAFNDNWEHYNRAFKFSDKALEYDDSPSIRKSFWR